jgi:hypothetical protein
MNGFKPTTAGAKNIFKRKQPTHTPITAPLLRIVQYSIRQQLLEDLPMVNLFLDRACYQQPVNGDVFLLANPPSTFSGLEVS